MQNNNDPIRYSQNQSRLDPSDSRAQDQNNDIKKSRPVQTFIEAIVVFVALVLPISFFGFNQDIIGTKETWEYALATLIEGLIFLGILWLILWKFDNNFKRKISILFFISLAVSFAIWEFIIVAVGDMFRWF